MKEKIHPLEWLGLAAILLAANASLLWGEVRSDWIYFPQGRGGWTHFTHPFVHVSLYHLTLDAGAVALLYYALGRHPLYQRLGAMLLCGLGSLAFAIAFTPGLEQLGFCGLSGIGHGLMAVVGFICIRDPNADPIERRIMGGLLVALLCKVCYESFTGRGFFASTHFGDVGTPVVVCHLGGVVGGVVFMWISVLAETWKVRHLLEIEPFSTAYGRDTIPTLPEAKITRAGQAP